MPPFTNETLLGHFVTLPGVADSTRRPASSLRWEDILENTFSENLAPWLPRDGIPEPGGDINACSAKKAGEKAPPA